MSTTDLWGNVTQTTLESDPATCVGCAGYHSSHRCRELRDDKTCQKRLLAESVLIAAIRDLAISGMVNQKVDVINDLIRVLFRAFARK